MFADNEVVTNIVSNYYGMLFIQFRPTFKEFQVLLCITYYSIKQSFVYTQLNDQTVLFLIIQFNASHFFKYQTVLFDLLIGPFQMLPLWLRVDLGAIAIKRYSIFLKAPGLEPHHQII